MLLVTHCCQWFYFKVGLYVILGCAGIIFNMIKKTSHQVMAALRIVDVKASYRYTQQQQVWLKAKEILLPAPRLSS